MDWFNSYHVRVAGHTSAIPVSGGGIESLRLFC
jgi:hypothetical protein